MSFRDQVVSGAANVAWNVFQSVNTRLPEGQPFQPAWASAPLLKSYQRSMPTLGFPRETDSLCPDCVKEVRSAIIEGTRDIGELVHGNPGEIRAQILEENGCILMRKTCSVHGPYEDVLSIDPEFTHLIENRFPGRDYSTWGDEHVHRHGTSSIKYGRGAVLTIDLTNRCNMMCNPCFMDANQVGYVHELTMDDVKRILDASISFKPRRQMSVQFSGGEPTISPHFLDACRYAKEVGYWCVQAATNGLRFAEEPDFAFEAKAAGFDMAYLQFDGVTNAANQHRHISNLFDAKLLAMENLSRAGIDINVVREPNDGYWSNVWLVKPFVVVQWGARPTPDVMFSLAYKDDAAWNESHWKNERFNTLLREAKAELDDVKRNDMYREMQLLCRDDGGTIVPFFRNRVFARRANVQHVEQMAGNWELDGARSFQRWWFES